MRICFAILRNGLIIQSAECCHTGRYIHLRFTVIILLLSPPFLLMWINYGLAVSYLFYRVVFSLTDTQTEQLSFYALVCIIFAVERRKQTALGIVEPYGSLCPRLHYLCEKTLKVRQFSYMGKHIELYLYCFYIQICTAI